MKALLWRCATSENDFAFKWLPRVDDDYSMLPTFDKMARGEMQGYFLLGQNPAAGKVPTQASAAPDSAS